MQRYKYKEAGEGAVGITFLALGFGVAWFVCLWVINWIYETKEARVDRAWAAAHPGVSQKVTLQNSDPGKYKVRCSGFILKTCEEVLQKKT